MLIVYCFMGSTTSIMENASFVVENLSFKAVDIEMYTLISLI